MIGNRLISLICAFDRALKTLHKNAHPAPKRDYPAQNTPESLFNSSEKQRRLSCYQMRINHTGEVCAQALYDGHYCVEPNKKEQKEWLKRARDEEVEHLLWCQRRLDEIGGRPSVLNPFFYAMSYSMARTLSSINPTWNMQFICETERQVFEHLSQQKMLLDFDNRSCAIIEQMRCDEKEHQETAYAFESQPLPRMAQNTMHLMARVMKVLVRFF